MHVRENDDQAAAESEAGKAYGTPYYISPEQIRGDVDIDFRADIYSLGATMYHMLAGRPPFEAETPRAVMHKHLKERAASRPIISVTTLSAGVGEVIEVAMAKDRDERVFQHRRHAGRPAAQYGDRQPPVNARHIVSLEEFERIEETGKTVDIARLRHH